MPTNPPDSNTGEHLAETNAADTARDKAAEQSPAKDRDAATKATSDQQAASEQQGSQGQRATDQAEQGQAREVGAGGGPLEWYGTGGGDGPQQHLLLLALDGATPELALGAWRGDLRTIAMLTERGAYARLQSTLPCASVPAWASLLTSLDPGQLGVYAAEQRPNHSYAPPAALDEHALHVPRLWDMLGSAGQFVGVVGAPLTSAATPVRGHLIGERHSRAALEAYPRAFAQQVAQWMADDTAPAQTHGSALELAIGQIYARTEQRFTMARRMLARASYNCFVLFDDGIAQIERLLWHTLDVTHLAYQPNHPLADVISAFYRFVDDQIAELLELLTPNTVVAVVSANGAQPLDGELALNDWLVATGELRLHTLPDQPTPLAECDVDWAHTSAWAGDNGMIYLNLAGREPAGTVSEDAAEPLLQRLAARLHSLQLPGATPSDGLAFAAHRPATIYAATQGMSPDLLVVGTKPGWRTTALVGHAQPWRSARSGGLDAAYESPRGMFVLYDPRNAAGGREISPATIYDVVPTLLNLFGITPPPSTRGHVLV